MSEVVLAKLKKYPSKNDEQRRGLFVEKDGLREFQIPERFLHKLGEKINLGDQLLIKLKDWEPVEVGLPFVLGEEYEASVECFFPEKAYGFLCLGKKYLTLFFHINACRPGTSIECIHSGDLVKAVVGEGRYPGTYAAKAIRFADDEGPATAKELKDLVTALQATARG